MSPDGLIIIMAVLDMNIDVIGTLYLLEGIDKLGLFEIQGWDAPYGEIGGVDLANFYFACLGVKNQLVVG